MGIVFRQAIKTTIVIFGGAVLGAGLNYCYTKVFPQNLLGASRNLITQGSVLYLFLLMGTISVVHTYAQRYSEDDPRRPVVITYSMLVPIAATLLFCIPYFFLKKYIVGRYQGFDRQYIDEFYCWLPLLGLLWSFMALLEYYLASRMKVALATSMREIVLRLGNVALVGLFFAGVLNFHQYVVATVLIHILPVGLLFYFSGKTKGFHLSFKWKIFTPAETRSIIHYSWYHMLLTISVNLTGMLDILLLGPLSPRGLSDVAIYSLALFLISILTIPYKAMTGAAFPKINEAFVNEDPAMKSMFIRSSLNMQIASVAMWLIVVCNLHNAVAVLPGNYAMLAPCVFILSLGRMINMGTGLNSELISITNHYKFTFRLSAVLVMAIIFLDRIFIPKYGLYGAAWVSTGTLAAFNILKMAFLHRKMRILPFSRQTGIIFLAGASLFLANRLLPALENPIIDACYRTAVLLLAFVTLMILLRPSPDLHDYLRQVRKTKRLF